MKIDTKKVIWRFPTIREAQEAAAALNLKYPRRAYSTGWVAASPTVFIKTKRGQRVALVELSQINGVI